MHEERAHHNKMKEFEVKNMSTRGCIARLHSRHPLEFTGVYHHWDGEPSILGRKLFRLRNTDFAGDTEAMLSVLIDGHPGTVVGARVSKTQANEGYPGPRSLTREILTQEDAADADVVFVYAFDGSTMLVLGTRYRTGPHDPYWVVLFEIALDGPEPNWASDGTTSRSK